MAGKLTLSSWKMRLEDFANSWKKTSTLAEVGMWLTGNLGTHHQFSPLNSFPIWAGSTSSSLHDLVLTLEMQWELVKLQTTGRTFSRKPNARTIACLCSSCAVLIPDPIQEQLKCKALMGRPGLWMHTQIIVGLFRWWLLATVHLPFLASEWVSPLLLTLQTRCHGSAGLYLLFPQARLSEGTASAWIERWGVSGDFLHQKLFPTYYTEA